MNKLTSEAGTEYRQKQSILWGRMVLNIKPKSPLAGWGNYPISSADLFRPERSHQLSQTQGRMGRSIVMNGHHAQPGEISSKSKDLSHISKKGGRSIPFDLPSWVLNSLAVKAFNAFYYKWQSRKNYPLLDEIDELVLKYGGRVYLAKDARMKPETFRAMYPRYPEWRRVKAAVDPEGRFHSDLSRRLGIEEKR
ncbi:MAG: FAD-dependent decaprenylphosphoryl-beta-D-ribofuranose 2-oxidase [Chlamydiae bacterium]|nr:FAD-dependent decaprenylphosphoryl-beta-D-ribofuranose 2-oxidase [Chlamydiota bacterium]